MIAVTNGPFNVRVACYNLGQTLKNLNLNQYGGHWPADSWELNMPPSGSDLQPLTAPGCSTPPPADTQRHSNMARGICQDYLKSLHTHTQTHTSPFNILGLLSGTHSGPEVAARRSRREVFGCCLVDLRVLCSEQGGQGPQGAVSRPQGGHRHIDHLCETLRVIPTAQSLCKHIWERHRHTYMSKI